MTGRRPRAGGLEVRKALRPSGRARCPPSTPLPRKQLTSRPITHGVLAESAGRWCGVLRKERKRPERTRDAGPRSGRERKGRRPLSLPARGSSPVCTNERGPWQLPRRGQQPPGHAERMELTLVCLELDQPDRDALHERWRPRPGANTLHCKSSDEIGRQTGPSEAACPRRPGDLEDLARLEDPATRRTRRPGDPATRRPGDPATATRRPGDLATRRPRRPGGRATKPCRGALTGSGMSSGKGARRPRRWSPSRPEHRSLPGPPKTWSNPPPFVAHQDVVAPVAVHRGVVAAFA